MKRGSNNLPRTIPAAKPASRAPLTRPPRLRRPPPPPARKVAQIVDSSDKSLVDVLDSLLNQGVVLNAELVLALTVSWFPFAETWCGTTTLSNRTTMLFCTTVVSRFSRNA